MVEETRRLFHHLVLEDRDFIEFFSADYTYVNADLAWLYDMRIPADVFAPVPDPAHGRRWRSITNDVITRFHLLVAVVRRE